MPSLYELKESYLNIQDAIENGEPLQPILDTLTEALHDKADSYAKVIQNLQSDIEAIKAEKKRLTDRQSLLEGGVEQLKENLFNAMKQTGETKFKTSLFSFNIQKNGGAAPVIVNVPTSELPDDMVIIIEKPDLRAIAKYIEETGDVSFATIGERGESLRIK